jgi:hypothetical protein
MQGKVTLEDHFAIEATLGDSQPFGAHVWPELGTACWISTISAFGSWTQAASRP